MNCTLNVPRESVSPKPNPVRSRVLQPQKHLRKQHFPQNCTYPRPNIGHKRLIPSYPQEIPHRYQHLIPKKFRCCSVFFLPVWPGRCDSFITAADLRTQCGAAKAPRDRRSGSGGFGLNDHRHRFRRAPRMVRHFRVTGQHRDDIRVDAGGQGASAFGSSPRSFRGARQLHLATDVERDRRACAAGSLRTSSRPKAKSRARRPPGQTVRRRRQGWYRPQG